MTVKRILVILAALGTLLGGAAAATAATAGSHGVPRASTWYHTNRT